MYKLGLFLLAGLLVCFSAQAADERYAVEVNVDVTDSSAAAAQQRAMNEANRAAVAAVAKRITTSDGVARLSAMTDDQLVNFVKEVSVIEEKSSAVRYIASLKVVLNEDMLKQYMKEREIPVMVQTNSTILVVPVFREFSSDAPQLWESTNMWKQAWDASPAGGTVRLVSLPASGANYAIMDARKAVALDGEALDKLMRLNGADDVYVLDATYDGIDGLVVRATSYSGDARTIRVEGPRSSGMELFDKAVSEVRNQLENRISQKSLSEASLENVIVVLYHFGRLQDWVALEKDLRSMNLVSNIEVQALGAGKVQFKLAYISSMDKLVQALRSHSYRLIEHDNYYTLERY